MHTRMCRNNKEKHSGQTGRTLTDFMHNVAIDVENQRVWGPALGEKNKILEKKSGRTGRDTFYGKPLQSLSVSPSRPVRKKNSGRTDAGKRGA